MSRLNVDADQLMEEGGALPFEMEGWIDTAPFEQLIGLEIKSATQGQAVLTMPFAVKLAQGGGLLHGGALTALADTAVAMAIKSLLPEGTQFATTELTMRFLAPVRQGVVTAHAEVSGPQGRTFWGEALLCDDSGQQVAKFQSVFRVARGQGFDE